MVFHSDGAERVAERRQFIEQFVKVTMSAQMRCGQGIESEADAGSIVDLGDILPIQVSCEVNRIKPPTHQVAKPAFGWFLTDLFVVQHNVVFAALKIEGKCKPAFEKKHTEGTANRTEIKQNKHYLLELRVKRRIAEKGVYAAL